MRRNAPPARLAVPVAGAALLAAFVLVAAPQATQTTASKPLATPTATPTPDQGATDGIPVAVKLAIQGGQPVSVSSVNPQKVQLSRKLKHKAHWYLVDNVDATISIVLKNPADSPFVNPPQSHGREALSEAPRANALKKGYPYNIKVHLNATNTDLPVYDPIIEIVD